MSISERRDLLNKNVSSVRSLFDFGPKDCFIRPLTALDTQAAAALFEESDWSDVDIVPVYAILNPSLCFVGTYASSQEAFKEAEENGYRLHWMH